MGNKKHKKKKKMIDQRSIPQTTSRGIISPETILKVTESIIRTVNRQTICLPLGCGVVRTARITSKGILFAGHKHYNSEYIQSFCGREVLIHEIDGYMRVYLYEEREGVLGGMICVHNINEEKQEMQEQHKSHPSEKEASDRLDWEEALKRVREARQKADR